MKRPPWENDDGSTDVDAFLAAYAADEAAFWICDPGDLMHVLDVLIERTNQQKGKQA